jgi:teichuronic acid biosynthesis glycosyltransferase TuaG
MNKELNTPLVSAIVTTYNRANLIGETINSILKQSFKNFELLIVDDGSTDNTGDVINSFQDKRIVYIKSDNWGGPARPRNIGIKRAKGEYIAFCDDDDLWVKDKLEKQLNIFKTYDVVGVGSLVQKFGAIDLHRKNTINSSYKTGRITFNDILHHQNSLALSSIIIRNLKHLNFQEDKQYIYVEDYLFQLHLTEEMGDLFIINEKLVKYRVHSNNGTKDPKKDENIFNVLKTYEHNLGDRYDKLILEIIFSKGYTSLRDNKIKDARRYLIKTAKFGNISIKIYSMAMLTFSFLPSIIRSIVLKTYFTNR